MSRLSPNQRIFADEYLKDRNATRAYMVAYPRVKDGKSAATCASETRRKPNVLAYIEKKLGEMSSDRIATATEVLEYFTATMRGETLEPVPRLDGDGRWSADAGHPWGDRDEDWESKPDDQPDQ